MYIQSFGGTNFDMVRLNANNFLNEQSIHNIIDIEERQIYSILLKQREIWIVFKLR